MKKFTYKARDKASEKIVESIVQADSEAAAARVLTEQGFVPIEIKEENGDGGLLDSLQNRITTKDKIVLIRQLATLIGAGLPLSQSLRTVIDQTSNKRLQGIVQEIIGDVEGGKPLSEALSKHPQVFDKVVLALVSAGETSGTLDEALKRIAAQQEKDAAMMSKIRGAMVYPVIVLLVITAVMIFMLIAVVPQVASLYEDMNKSLPFLTQIMINIANFIINYWYIVLLAAGAAVYFTMQYFKTNNG
jgi:type IV pilus assembly protein PilC